MENSYIDPKTEHQHIEMAENKLELVPTSKSDEERLARMGHVQELRRDFSIWSLGALCLCLMATWEALSTVIATALIAGGAPCLFWNLYVRYVGNMNQITANGEQSPGHHLYCCYCHVSRRNCKHLSNRRGSVSPYSKTYSISLFSLRVCTSRYTRTIHTDAF